VRETDTPAPEREPDTGDAPKAPSEFLILNHKESCTECWGCVRHCPARAISVVDGRSEIIQERCVKCGICVWACGRAGHPVRDDTEIVESLLASGRPVVALLASEYVAAMHPMTPDEIENALEQIGFLSVETTVLGEELVATAYEQAHARESMLPRLRSTCPVTVDWVRKFHPQLVKALVPVLPPYLAHARLIRALYPEDTAVVYISPCYARKDEIYDEPIAGLVDVAITFDELRLLFAGVRAGGRPLSAVGSGRRARASKQLSLTDGFPRRTVREHVGTDPTVVTVRGLDELEELLSGIERGETAPEVVDMLLCEGCIDGPAVARDLSVFMKRSIASADKAAQPEPPVDSRTFLGALPHVDLMRTFWATPAPERCPTDDEIDASLALGELDRSTVIDCGACGFDHCVEHAEAVALGHSSWDMCFPLQRKQLERTAVELAEQASSDALTGLANRREFDRRLEDEVARAQRYKTSVSLLMVDLDGFKEINDGYGHVAGDMVLQAVADLLRKQLRATDVPVRYGGDEFALVLPNTTKTEAYAVAEKLLWGLRNLRIAVDGPGVTLTTSASVGVAAFGERAHTADALLDAADRALYEAKGAGRDQVRIAPG